MKILVISLAGIGDTILATPLIHELRAGFPQAQIDALVLWAGSRDVLEGNPHLNTIYQRNLIKENKAESLAFLQRLRRARYDVSINAHPQSRMQYRAIARFIGARLRLSHEYECSGPFDRLLVNRTLPQNYQRHSIDLNLDVLAELGCRPALSQHELEIYLSPADHQWGEELVDRHQLRERPWLGLHAGSGGTKNLALKRWPLGHYVELVGKLRAARPELPILLFGGPDEDAELERIMAPHPSPLLVRVRSKTLKQAGALMQRGAAFLSVDTALMHLAAAVKAPGQIVIEAPTLNKTNEPYGNPYVLVPNPAIGGRNLEYYRYDGRGIKGTPEELTRLMAAVSVDAVFEAVKRVLDKA
jgi:ADP-heptose:LPS heptosyltransferase